MALLYTAVVTDTMASPTALYSSLNPREKCQSMMRLKMSDMVASLKSLMDIVLKWRRKRGDTGFLPPPGGPMAAMSKMSTRLICCGGEEKTLHLNVINAVYCCKDS